MIQILVFIAAFILITIIIQVPLFLYDKHQVAEDKYDENTIGKPLTTVDIVVNDIPNNLPEPDYDDIITMDATTINDIRYNTKVDYLIFKDKTVVIILVKYDDNEDDIKTVTFTNSTSIDKNVFGNVTVYRFKGFNEKSQIQLIYSNEQSMSVNIEQTPSIYNYPYLYVTSNIVKSIDPIAICFTSSNRSITLDAMVELCKLRDIFSVRLPNQLTTVNLTQNQGDLYYAFFKYTNFQVDYKAPFTLENTSVVYNTTITYTIDNIKSENMITNQTGRIGTTKSTNINAETLNNKVFFNGNTCYGTSDSVRFIVLNFNALCPDWTDCNVDIMDGDAVVGTILADAKINKTRSFHNDFGIYRLIVFNVNVDNAKIVVSDPYTGDRLVLDSVPLIVDSTFVQTFDKPQVITVNEYDCVISTSTIQSYGTPILTLKDPAYNVYIVSSTDYQFTQENDSIRLYDINTILSVDLTQQVALSNKITDVFERFNDNILVNIGVKLYDELRISYKRNTFTVYSDSSIACTRTKLSSNWDHSITPVGTKKLSFVKTLTDQDILSDGYACDNTYLYDFTNFKIPVRIVQGKQYRPYVFTVINDSNEITIKPTEDTGSLFKFNLVDATTYKRLIPKSIEPNTPYVLENIAEYVYVIADDGEWLYFLDKTKYKLNLTPATNINLDYKYLFDGTHVTITIYDTKSYQSITVGDTVVTLTDNVGTFIIPSKEETKLQNVTTDQGKKLGSVLIQNKLPDLIGATCTYINSTLYIKTDNVPNIDGPFTISITNHNTSISVNSLEDINNMDLQLSTDSDVEVVVSKGDIIVSRVTVPLKYVALDIKQTAELIDYETNKITFDIDINVDTYDLYIDDVLFDPIMKTSYGPKVKLSVKVGDIMQTIAEDFELTFIKPTLDQQQIIKHLTNNEFEYIVDGIETSSDLNIIIEVNGEVKETLPYVATRHIRLVNKNRMNLKQVKRQSPYAKRNRDFKVDGQNFTYSTKFTKFDMYLSRDNVRLTPIVTIQEDFALLNKITVSTNGTVTFDATPPLTGTETFETVINTPNGTISKNLTIVDGVATISIGNYTDYSVTYGDKISNTITYISDDILRYNTTDLYSAEKLDVMYKCIKVPFEVAKITLDPSGTQPTTMIKTNGISLEKYDCNYIVQCPYGTSKLYGFKPNSLYVDFETIPNTDLVINGSVEVCPLGNNDTWLFINNGNCNFPLGDVATTGRWTGHYETLYGKDLTLPKYDFHLTIHRGLNNARIEVVGTNLPYIRNCKMAIYSSSNELLTSSDVTAISGGLVPDFSLVDKKSTKYNTQLSKYETYGDVIRDYPEFDKTLCQSLIDMAPPSTNGEEHKFSVQFDFTNPTDTVEIKYVNQSKLAILPYDRYVSTSATNIQDFFKFDYVFPAISLKDYYNPVIVSGFTLDGKVFILMTTVVVAPDVYKELTLNVNSSNVQIPKFIYDKKYDNGQVYIVSTTSKSFELLSKNYKINDTKEITMSLNPVKFDDKSNPIITFDTSLGTLSYVPGKKLMQNGIETTYVIYDKTTGNLITSYHPDLSNVGFYDYMSDYTGSLSVKYQRFDYDFMYFNTTTDDGYEIQTYNKADFSEVSLGTKITLDGNEFEVVSNSDNILKVTGTRLNTVEAESVSVVIDGYEQTAKFLVPDRYFKTTIFSRNITIHTDEDILIGDFMGNVFRSANSEFTASFTEKFSIIPPNFSPIRSLWDFQIVDNMCYRQEIQITRLIIPFVFDEL